jgi:ubiquinone/menaquinone biosynthesis C-methylase UbiE
MNEAVSIQERTAQTAFNKQAPFFDDLYGKNTIIQYKRERVREHVLQYLKPHASILELNSGTGEDAVCFAKKGYTVHATDISEKMQQVLFEKMRAENLQERITTELCSFTNLENLSKPGPYDHIFSNFAGLNCTNKLNVVLNSFNYLLKPNGMVTLVLLPKFCLWEFLLLFKGKFKTALRRFAGRNGAKAHIEGEYFRCWYYNPSYVVRHLKETFDLVSLEGLCITVPPSYMEGFPEKHPHLYRKMVNKEKKWRSRWPWRCIGDYYIITLKKKG